MSASHTLPPDDPQPFVDVRAGALSVDEVLAAVADPSVGGTCLFLGTVRDEADGVKVVGLVYESWDEIARQRLAAIGREMLSRWPLRRAAIAHRTGDLAVGEVSVIVAAAAAHRAEAFEACRFGIERLKEGVPIWKKELLATGESAWVEGG